MLPARRLPATAEVSLAPGPHETFGLSALESMAGGTPVVVSASAALSEVIGPAGVAALDTPAAFAAGVTTLLAADENARRVSARARAEQFEWRHAVEHMLAVLGGAATAGPSALRSA